MHRIIARFAAVLAFLLPAHFAAALETTRIDLREGGENDGQVTITRQDGELLFDDVTTSAPVPLAQLAGTGVHGALGGLDGDDHPQYLDAARHAGAHDATLNDALAISPDVAGNTSLGAHAADSIIHLSRTGNEIVTGNWSFGGTIDLTGGQIHLTNNGTTDPVVVTFDGPVQDPALTFFPLFNRLHFTHTLSAGIVQAGLLDAEAALVRGELSGDADGVRTGVLRGFQSIEGIAHGDLLSRSRAEEIAAPWDFLGGVNVAEVLDAEALLSRGQRWHHFTVLGSAGSHVGWTSGGAAVHADTAGAIAHFEIALGEDTLIHAIRVKWQADDEGDGVRVRLLKRDESGTASAFTTVVSDVDFTGGTAVEVDTHMLSPAVAIEADTAYLLQVESIVAGTGVSLYSWGVETSERGY